MISNRTRVNRCTKHQNKKATVYCSTCRSFYCSDCEATHNTLFGDAHKTIPASSVTKFDLQGGKCADHNDYPLDSLCKDCLGKYFTHLVLFNRFKSDRIFRVMLQQMQVGREAQGAQRPQPRGVQRLREGDPRNER